MAETVVTAPEGQRYLTITRSFKAPADLVYRAYVEPELLQQWMGPHGYTMDVQENDLRHGGKWAFSHNDPDGNEYEFRGVYHGDPSVNGIIRTFSFMMYPNDASLETLAFTEQNGETTVHVTSVFLSQEARDGMIASGMETGVREGNERLDELLARM